METLLYILKAAGILSLFYIVYSLFLKKETLFTTNRHFLLIGILVSVSFPLLQFTKTVLLEVPAMEAESISTNASSAVIQSHFAIETSNFFTFENILIAIYIIGVLFLLLRCIYQLFSVIFLLKKYSFEKINGFKFIKVSEAISPFSFFNYVVFNPEMHSENELGMILAHEKVHAIQYHSIDVLLSNLLVTAQWFNPLAWQYKKSMEENLEYIADRNTIKQVQSKKEYQLALVKASSALLLPALTNNFYKSFIKKRIIMLNKSKSNNRNALKAALVLPLLVGFLWSFNVNEVTEYIEIASEKAPIEAPVIKEEVVKPISEENKETPQAKTIEKTVAVVEKKEIMEAEKTPIQDKYRTKIDKNTTDTKLQEIKEVVKNSYGIDLIFSANRNTENEITSISANYSAKGSNGNYQVSGGSPIDEFFFYIDENGKAGFWSEAAEKRNIERMEKRQKKMQERNNERGNRSKEMKERLDERRVEIEERRLEIEENRTKAQNSYSMASSGKGGNSVVISSGGKGSVYIDRYTTDKELVEMKRKLAAKKIDFEYKNVKRNNAGEITSIKVSTNDNKGSKTNTVIKGNDGSAIDQITIN